MTAFQNRISFMPSCGRFSLNVIGLFSIMALLTLSCAAQAQFDYTIVGGTAVTITSYRGAGGVVSIPGTIEHLPVTAIGNDAFSGADLTAVDIPDSVTSIGHFAFSDCTNLTTVTIGSGLSFIGSSALYNCLRLTSFSVSTSNSGFGCAEGVLFNKSYTELVRCPPQRPGSYTIPSTVTEIRGEAFSGCSKLTNISIPDGVSYLSGWMFGGCTMLLSIEVSASNPNFSSLDGVLFNKTQTKLTKCPQGKAGSYAIPAGVSSIGSSAFSGCTNLDSVSIPDSVIWINERAFSDCTGLTSIIIPDGVAVIGYAVFSGCTNLNSVSIPDSATIIKGYAFLDCTCLASIVIPNGVTSIGYSAFSGCTNLSSVSIPGSVIRIDDYAFAGCARLSSITIPDGVSQIGNSVFVNCENLVSIEVSPLNAGFSSFDGVLFNKDQTTLLAWPAGKAGHYTIPATVNSIGDFAFSDCSNLNGITIPSSVTSIGEGAFYDSDSITAISIPSSVTSIGYGAFFFCSRLEAAIFEGSAPAMGASVFEQVADGFGVFYFNGGNGFTSPTWNGYPAINLGAKGQVTLAAERDEAAGLENIEFATFGTPALNDSDDVTWQSVVCRTDSGELNGSGIWVQSGTSQTLIARSGQDAAGVSGGVFSTFDDPLLNDNSKVAFCATLTTGTGGVMKGKRTGIWATTSGSLAIVARAGMNAPGCPTGAKFAVFSRIVLTDNDQVLFTARLKSGLGNVSDANDRGLWLATSQGEMKLLLREGEKLKVGSRAKRVRSFSVFKSPGAAGGQSRNYNRDGWATGLVRFTDGTGGILQIRPDGTSGIVAVTGNAVPGIKGATFAAFGNPAINDDGGFAFRARVTSPGITRDNDTGLWADVGPTRFLITRTNAVPPGVPEGRFTAFTDPAYDNNGHVAFLGTMRIGRGGVTAANATGVWSDSSGNLSLVARAGGDAPGCEPGARFKSFLKVVLPDQGGTVVLAKLIRGKGGVDDTNDEGLWAVDTENQLQLIVRKGGVVIAGGEVRTISQISVFGSSSAKTSAQSRSFNHPGDLAYRLTFTDGSQAICKLVFP